ncbi:uncharacterized protein BYT42DRAFT_573912 [Radiomyces spectabilis]|uniref:uncharacterized protein n=1 Tax=Radiomyces spectabilis TaxID=64574 RepID=UPI00221E658E|nr:uncharacterized protein BYT42DRAFT_573912 [Radiomyces spectabilis]KAI8376241.1 hypothetical protein BYT42DRAFT_573912 [Radiomyces spectabilis]
MSTDFLDEFLSYFPDDPNQPKLGADSSAKIPTTVNWMLDELFHAHSDDLPKDCQMQPCLLEDDDDDDVLEEEQQNSVSIDQFPGTPEVDHTMNINKLERPPNMSADHVLSSLHGRKDSFSSDTVPELQSPDSDTDSDSDVEALADYPYANDAPILLESSIASSFCTFDDDPVQWPAFPEDRPWLRRSKRRSLLRLARPSLQSLFTKFSSKTSVPTVAEKPRKRLSASQRLTQFFRRH